MSWDSIKIDDTPEDLVNGILDASDWNDQVVYIKSAITSLGVIDGGDSTG